MYVGLKPLLCGMSHVYRGFVKPILYVQSPLYIGALWSPLCIGTEWSIPHICRQRRAKCAYVYVCKAHKGFVKFPLYRGLYTHIYTHTLIWVFLLLTLSCPVTLEISWATIIKQITPQKKKSKKCIYSVCKAPRGFVKSPLYRGLYTHIYTHTLIWVFFATDT